MEKHFQKVCCLVFLFLLLSQSSIAQIMEEKLESLKKENDSLKIELENCLNVPINALLNIEQRILNAPPQKNEESLEEFRKRILIEIINKSEEKYKTAQRIINHTDEFLLLCNSIRDNMMERTGGYDQTKKNPVIGYKNNEIVGKVLIEEGKGEMVKIKMTNLRQTYLSVNNNESKDLTEKISLTAKNWNPENFVALPFAAFLPYFASQLSHAKNSERAVLEFLNK